MIPVYVRVYTLQWRHNGSDSVSNHQPHDCFNSTVYSDPDQTKHQSFASLAFARGTHRWPVNSPHKGPVTRKNVSIWWRHHDNVLCMQRWGSRWDHQKVHVSGMSDKIPTVIWLLYFVQLYWTDFLHRSNFGRCCCYVKILHYTNGFLDYSPCNV